MMTKQEVMDRAKLINDYNESLLQFNMMLRIHTISMTFSGDTGRNATFMKGLDEYLRAAAKDHAHSRAGLLAHQLTGMNVSVDFEHDINEASRISK